MITSYNSTGEHMNGKHAVLKLPIFAIVKLKGELLPQITALDISTSHGC